MLKLDAPENQPPLLTVFGGKITTFRRLAEAVMEKFKPFFPRLGQPWTASAPLPGGDFPLAEVEARITDLGRRYPFLARATARRLFRAYGTHAEALLAGAKSAADMGAAFGPLSEREVNYLIAEEWAETSDDILWRRSKLGLTIAPDERAKLDHHLDQRLGGSPRQASQGKAAGSNTRL